MRLSKRNFGGGGLMVWAAFQDTNKLQLAFVSNKMGSEEYQEMLDACLVPHYEDHDEDQLVFQQDGAPAHRSQSTRTWLEARNIVTLNWPACSPDLNPMENVWGVMVRRIYADNRVYSNLNELRTAIVDCWGSLEANLFDNLNLSMNNRIFQLINRNGGATDY